MIDKTIQPGDTAGGLSAFFDWHARRNWIVLFGSALVVGLVAAAVWYFVSVVWLGLPLAAVSSGEATKGALFGALMFMAIILLLGGLATRRRVPNPEGSAAAVAPDARRAALWRDLAVYLLWCVVFPLPSLAMQYMLFGLPDTTGAGEVAVMVDLMGIVIGPIFLPGLLQRWGTLKAAPDPSPRGQANAGWERRP